MSFWLGVVAGSMLGSLVAVAFLSLVIVGKEADEEMEKAWKGFDEKV